MGVVQVETVQQHVGWAVFLGADGEDMHFVAYFECYDRARDYIAKCKDSDDEFYMGDADVVAAIINPADGSIMLANEVDYVKGAEFLCECAEIAGDDAGLFLEAARAAMAERGGGPVEPAKILWGGKWMQWGKCPPGETCLACDRLGKHLEPAT